MWYGYNKLTMTETTTVQQWKRDKGINPEETGQIAKYRAKIAEETTDNTTKN
jgi:hypothetical protein